MPFSNRANCLRAADRRSESELVALLASKAPEGFSILYNQYAPNLYGVALRITASHAQAQDVVQEALVKAWLHLDQYDPAKGRLFTWLLNVVRHAAIDYLRSPHHRLSSRIDAVEDPDRQSRQLGNYSPSVDHIGLPELLAGLHQDYRLLLEYAYFKGFTHVQIARTLEMPLGTVKTRLRAAIMHLRVRYKEECAC